MGHPIWWIGSCEIWNEIFLSIIQVGLTGWRQWVSLTDSNARGTIKLFLSSFLRFPSFVGKQNIARAWRRIILIWIWSERFHEPQHLWCFFANPNILGLVKKINYFYPPAGQPNCDKDKIGMPPNTFWMSTCNTGYVPSLMIYLTQSFIGIYQKGGRGHC